MQKILIITIIFFILSSCTWQESKGENKTKQTNTWIIETTQTGTQTDEEPEVELSEEEIKKQKVENIRKKLALRWLILKWRVNIENEDWTSALVKYLQIYKEVPNDPSTILALGDIYYNLKNFKKAYSYYEKIKDYDKLDKHRAAITLISSQALTSDSIQYMNEQLDTLWLWDEELFYYKNSLWCQKDFSMCKKNFQDYFLEQDEIEQQIMASGSWVIEEHYTELYNIKTALENYENFQIDDLYFKWALVSWAYYENGLYPIAIETAEKLLSDKSDYKPLLKITAKSYFELGNYIEAKLHLIEYNKLVKSDPDASYFLWVVYEKLHEYVLSTIHFKKALKDGYEWTIDIHRRILFNYYEIWEVEKMLEEFQTILIDTADEATLNDYNLAIYYHILNEKMSEAKEFSKQAMEKYPDSEIFYWYYGWILMDEVMQSWVSLEKTNLENSDENSWSILDKKDNIEESPFSEAESYIDRWLEINKQSPMLNLVKWKLEMAKGNLSKAYIYFKKTVSLDEKWDFWKIALQELDTIQINK